MRAAQNLFGMHYLPDKRECEFSVRRRFCRKARGKVLFILAVWRGTRGTVVIIAAGPDIATIRISSLKILPMSETIWCWYPQIREDLFLREAPFPVGPSRTIFLIARKGFTRLGDTSYLR